ncbi:FecCD family ABC transporter permease [Streptococcus catagoni]|uniref:FecCD family ABC transporter permease n=1 Tax=Streptococcus catagoni TaxID=2654874 RepID=UPI0014092D59|nr:iron ABC transporter permease [Streptococcus catagoni]
MKNRDFSLRHSNKPNNLWLLFLIIAILFVIGLYLSLRFGAWHFSKEALYQILIEKTGTPRQESILLSIRLPRIIATILVGAALAVSGMLMQAITRNPIADPGLLGINTGAALALAVSYTFLKHLHYSQIILVCLLGSALASLIVFSLSYQPGKGYQQLRLVLAGAVVSTFLSAIGQAIINYFHLANSIIGWQAGGFIGVNWKMLSIIAPIILLGLVLTQFLSYQLTILSLDETRAQSLGQNTRLMNFIFLAIVLLLSSASVAIAGNIAFVGLIIPHLIKSFAAGNYKLNTPMTALAGATFMMWVDLLCRTLNPPYETPITAVISFLGLPVFLWLAKKGGQL